MFCPHPKLDAELLMGSIQPVFSELGSLKHRRESQIINFFQDFIQGIEGDYFSEFLKAYFCLCMLCNFTLVLLKNVNLFRSLSLNNDDNNGVICAHMQWCMC